MTDRLPPPMTPTDCDLRDFRGMMLDVVRFTQSDLVNTGSPEGVLAALRLYCAAWHQVPAGSIPDNDRSLAQLAGFGRAVDAFLPFRDEALHKFVKCSDGRLYHPVVAEKALQAWAGKLKQRYRTFAATIRKHNERHPNAKLATPSYEEWDAAGRPERREDWGRPAEPPRQGDLGLDEGDEDDESPDPSVRARPRGTGAPPTPAHTGENAVTRDNPQASHATGVNVARDDPPLSHVKSTPRDRDRDRDRETLPTGLIESPQAPLAVAEALAAELADLGAVRLATDAARATATREVETWLAAGISPDTMREAVKAFTAKTRTPSRALHRFDGDVRLLHAKGSKAPPKRRSQPAKSPDPGPDSDDPRIAELRATLRQTWGARTYDGWLKPGRFTLNGSGLTLNMPSRFLADWVADNLGRELANEVARLDLPPVTITYPTGETP